MRILVPALGLVCLASSCTLNTDYFSEYRGVNLLGNYNFNATYSVGNPKWKLGTDPDFMTWEAVPTDPERPTEAYRLEIKNLIPNGDFEDAAVTPDATAVPLGSMPAGWTTSFWDGTPATSAAVVNFGATPSNTIHNGSIGTGRAMGWDALGSGNQLRLALSNQVLPTAWRPMGYLFRVDLINVGTGASVGMSLYQDATNTVPPDTLYNAPDWTVNTIKDGNITDNTSIYSVSREFLLSAATDVRNIAFGPNSSTGNNAAVIDNVRLLPRSEQLVVSASFSSLSSGILELEPGSKDGMYIFTVDVKNDPNTGASNHFRPKNFSVLFEASVKSGSRNRLITIPAPASGWPTWTTLTFQLGFDFVNGDADLAGQPAFKVSLSPTVSSTGDYDVGTVLVSRPSLTFNP